MWDKEKQRVYRKKYYQKHKGELSAYSKKYYQEHRERLLLRQRNYHRQTCLSITKNGVKLHGLNKRPYTGYCEVCGVKKPRFLHYHHWKEDPNIGLWLCTMCHYMAEGLDKGLDKAYQEIKNLIFRKVLL